LRLVDRAIGVPETPGTTSFPSSVRLEDGPYSWRAHASDPTQDGPWSDSAGFKVAVAPAAPVGLTAVPGDRLVSLAWNASPEPDVTGYQVYRSLIAGGPYAFLVATPSTTRVDTGLTNGVTYYYVVTAVDAAVNQSPYSLEAAATPFGSPTKVTAEVRYRPTSLGGECLQKSCTALAPTRAAFFLPNHGGKDRDDDDDDDDDDHESQSVVPILECVAPNPDGGYLAFFGYRSSKDGILVIPVGSDNQFSPSPKDRGQTQHFAAGRTPKGRPAFAVAFKDGQLVWTLKGRTAKASASSLRCGVPPPPANTCPQWVYATVELPTGLDPATILVDTVRLSGDVKPDLSYHPIVDTDRDGVSEMELRFEMASLRGRLQLGTHTLTLVGRTPGTEFEGSATLTVFPLSVNLWITPRQISSGASGDVKARLTFLPEESASQVDVSSVRLNGTVRVKRVVSTRGNEIVVAFDRAQAVRGSTLRATGSGNRRGGPSRHADHDHDDDDDDDLIEVTVTGTIRCLPFTARDEVEVKR
jgi:hypothetical protein